MGKFERKKDAVKDYFEDRAVFSKIKKYDKAVVSNSLKMHELGRKLGNINNQIAEIDNKPKKRNMNLGESATTLTLGTIIPVGVAWATGISSVTAPDTTPAIQDTLWAVASVAIHSTIPVALGTYLGREYRVVGRTFDALKKRALRRKADRVQEDINTCKIYQIGLTGQEEPLAEYIVKNANARFPKKEQVDRDPNFQYLDREITEADIDGYMEINFD